MVTFKLFANVNPLKPNNMVCVLDASSCGTVNLDTARSFFCKRANGLACKGYDVKLLEISDRAYTVVDYTKFV